MALYGISEEDLDRVTDGFPPKLVPRRLFCRSLWGAYRRATECIASETCSHVNKGIGQVDEGFDV